MSKEKELSHIDEDGNARMVDVSAKNKSLRRAVAEALVILNEATLKAVKDGNGPKGDVLGPARIAGIMAAKKTAELIPLCHPLNLDYCNVEFSFVENGIKITAEAKAGGVTGVEMEAITAASVAAVTIYDMCKALDKGIVISEIKLMEKDGGKSGPYRRNG